MAGGLRRSGDIAAGARFNFFVEEIGLVIDIQAVAAVQERLQARVAEIGSALHEDEFQYGRKFGTSRKGRT